MTSTNAASPLAAEPAAARPLGWTVWRELVESPSILVAPAAVAALSSLGALAALFHLPERMPALAALSAVERHARLVTPVSLAVAPIMFTAFVVGALYCLDALHGERRDRSILFWKSLPVSDATTVLAKALVPLAVLPLSAFALSLVTFFGLLFASAPIFAAHGLDPSAVWREVHRVQEPLVMIYGLAAHTLWFAPTYGFLILVSAWARRTPILWVALPPIALGAVERATLGSSHVAAFARNRLDGAMREAFVTGTSSTRSGIFDQLSQLSPLRFVSSPGLWLGLLFAAAFLAAAVRLRRSREPI